MAEPASQGGGGVPNGGIEAGLRNMQLSENDPNFPKAPHVSHAGALSQSQVAAGNSTGSQSIGGNNTGGNGTGGGTGNAGGGSGSRATFTYNAERVLGSGSFGIVYQAQVVETGETVAIKKVFQDKRYKNRELQIMKELTHTQTGGDGKSGGAKPHPNIVELKHAFYTSGDKTGETFLNVVMEYCSDTVYRVMKHYCKLKQPMPLIYVKVYSYQLSKACSYIHAVGICHRDIKPQNLLVDGKSHSLKLCDFGSAKRLVRGEPNVAYICSRYYRAPELIFGATDYTTAIDIWSAACVTAEMILGQPLFPGESGVDQLVEIIKVLGTPTREQLTSMNPNYTEFKFPQIKAHPWSKVFRQRTSPDAIDFVSKLLQYDPKARPHGLESLLHGFFDELRESPNLRLSSSKALPELFYFCKEELSVLAEMPAEAVQKLMPPWSRQEGQILPGGVGVGGGGGGTTTGATGSGVAGSG